MAWIKSIAWSRIVAGTMVTASFFFVGLFVGWLSGESRVPVIATLLTIIMSLFASLMLLLFERKALVDKAHKILDDAAASEQLDPGTSGRLKAAFGDKSEATLRLPAFCGLGLLVFSAGCFLGFKQGIGFRVPEYPPVAELTKGTTPSPFELSLLHELIWHLQSNHRRPDEVIALFETSIKPILTQEEIDKRYDQESRCRLARLEWVVNRMLNLKRSDTAIPCSAKIPGESHGNQSQTPEKPGIAKPQDNSNLIIPQVLDLASAYWTTSVDGARRVQLKIRFKDAKTGDGELIFNGNTVRFNDFADQTSTTAVAFQPHKIKLVHIVKKDPSGRGRRLYSILGDGLPGVFTLVAPGQDGTNYTLVVTENQPEKGQSVILLGPMREIR